MKMIIRKKKKKHIILKLIMIIIIGVICSFILIKNISKRISLGVMVYAEDEVRRIVTIVINDSVNDEIIDEINDDKLFEIVRNDNGEIQLVSYDVKNVNILLNKIALIVQDNLKLIELGDVDKIKLISDNFDEYDIELLKKGIISRMPFGSFMNSTLLSNIGPKIPVKFSLVGDVTTNIVSNVKEYGINNALLEVSIEVIVNARVHLPLTSNVITVSNSMPISMKIIQGDIPDFYNGSFKSTFGIVDIYNSL